MKKIFIIIIIQFNIILCIYPTKSVNNYNNLLKIPDINELKVKTDQKEELKPSSFIFKIGKIDSDINISGMWKIKLGFASGFTLYPDIKWLLTYPGMLEGMIFEQSRFFTLDWITDMGIYLHLFINDNAEDTEITFRYTYGKIFNSLYITNKPPEIQINPYRSIKGGRPQDINFGFDWGNKVYQGRFDAQFDSVKSSVDKFKGGKIDKTGRLTSARFERGIYYYLPDKNLTGIPEIYLNDPDGMQFTDFDLGPDDSRKFIKLYENTDFIVDYKNGFIKFRESVFGKNLLIYYQAVINGNIYDVGDDQCGNNGILGTIDFNSAFPEYNKYIKTHNGKRYLVLSFSKDYSYFEEKNSYKIAKAGSLISQLNIDIFNENNVKQTGFKYLYDEFTGCVRVTDQDKKGIPENIYPFQIYEETGFYTTNYSPNAKISKITVDYSCYIQNKDLKLSNKPVQNSIKVIYNSKILASDQYYYDAVSMSVLINFETGETDIIEIYYLTDEEESYNLTLALKNDFRLNKFLIIGDSLWYKMPIKLWEDSYYFKMHSMEFMYFGHLYGDFTKLLKIKDNSKLKFELNAGFSMYYPELKGLTILEDFEYDLNGYKLNLNYQNWWPVNIPAGVYAELAAAVKGRMYYRNMHKYGLPNGTSFLSLYDQDVPSFENYTDNSSIGPYSSCDGFTYYLNDKKFIDKSNTLSLITEIDLDPNEAVSIIYPVSSFTEEADISQFNGLNMALKVDKRSGGAIYIFVDAGKISERYNDADGLVQNEILDEGIKYEITDSGNYTLYKGRSDGNNSTNDYDGNGILDNDEISEITKFIFTDTNMDYAVIEKKYNNLIFKADDIEKLRYMRGIRITVYSPDGADARLIFNQIRFTESGWEYNKSINSSASEISPIEDSYLINNIFSEKNHEIDSKLHYQRFRERTLKINLTQNEKFQIEKKFFNPVDISNFNKISFFTLLQNPTLRKIRIIMKDTDNNNIEKIIDLKNHKPDKWEKSELLFNTFDNYNSSSKLITKIKLEFINELSDTDDNIIYIDEFYMEEPHPSLGFGTKNNFIYSNPSYVIKNKNFKIFNSPYFDWTAEFDTADFLKNELMTLKDHLILNKIVYSFALTEINYFFMSNLEFILNDAGVYNTAEDLRIKINKSAKINNPFFFTLYYDYSKTDTLNITGSDAMTKNEKRNLIMELGANFRNNFIFSVGYDIATSKMTKSLTASKFYTDFECNLNALNSKISYSLSNTKYSEILEGNYSLDNLYDVFHSDFISFFDHGENKIQNFHASTNFYIIKPLLFVNNISVKHQSNILNMNDNYDFIINYSNSVRLDLIINIKENKDTFISMQYDRNILNDYQRHYTILYWKNYFDEFYNSVNYITPLFFYPPFSSLYKSNGNFIGSNNKFSELSDILKLNIDWRLFLNRKLFCPYLFSFKVKETIINKIIYDPSYMFSFNLSGGSEISNSLFNIFELKYFTEEEIILKKEYNTYKTNNSITFMLSTGKFIDFETSFLHELTLTDGQNNIIIDHFFILSFLLYKSFYKKNTVNDDIYGFDMSYRLDIKSRFHVRKDGNPVVKVDNPIDMLLTVRLGYKFNRNFTLTSEIKGGYSFDYSQYTLSNIHRFGFEASLEGILTF